MICYRDNCKECNLKYRFLEHSKLYGWHYVWYCEVNHFEVGIEGLSGRMILPTNKIIKGFYQTYHKEELKNGVN